MTLEPSPWNGARVRQLRYALSLSQSQLAKHLNVSTHALKTWEKGERKPRGSAVRLLYIVEQHPEWLVGSGDNIVTPTNAAVPPVDHTHDEQPVEEARTKWDRKVRPLPEWWREHTIIRVAEFLRQQLKGYGEKFLLLGRPCADAPATLEAATRALGPGPFPDLAIFPPEANAAGHWSAIKWVRLVVDVLPTTRPAGSATPNLVRWPDLEIRERWIVDPFNHRFTICRPDTPTRHYTKRLVWRVTRFARPIPISLSRFFIAYSQYPDEYELAKPTPDVHPTSNASEPPRSPSPR
jgi:transcriptional regulator with XRE-family HTH domain